MSSHLLDRALPTQLAMSGQVIDCKVNFRDLGRITEVVESDLAALPAGDASTKWRDAPVNIRLAFSFVQLSEAVPAVTGEISTTLEAVCQRCLQACSLPLKASLRYVLVPYKDRANTLDEYETWELTEKTIRPLDIVEEALLMAMPFPALHELTEQCGSIAQEVLPESAETVRPFADLRAQLDEFK
jgi:uncharacterized metal-binding protein YceD (DUF177 family)